MAHMQLFLAESKFPATDTSITFVFFRQFSCEDQTTRFKTMKCIFVTLYRRQVNVP